MDSKVKKIITLLKRNYNNTHIALRHRNAFELLIATILSAQCTDIRVNIVTETLFKKFSTPALMASASLREITHEIRSINFFNMKARALKETSIRIVSVYSGKVPNTMKELLTLRGVARKTANVVLGNWFGEPDGVVVDTHVGRVAQRLGLTKNKKPTEIERDLNHIIPYKYWVSFSHWLIAHGRTVCNARTPKCTICPLRELCPTGKKLLEKRERVK